jgi:homoserine/homoserine lactone efflux protein
MIVRSFAVQPQGPSASPASERSFWQGFVTQGANPNLLVYFTAILPQFVDPNAPLGAQVAILAVSSFAIEFAVLSAYCLLSHRAGRRAGSRFRLVVERLGGGLLIGAGAGLASIGRA